MCQLRKPDQWQAHWGRDQVVSVWLRLTVMQPAHDVQAFDIHLLRPWIPSQRLQLLGRACYEIFREGGVCSVSFSQLLKIFLYIALAAKDGVDSGLVVVGSSKESR